MERVCPTLAGQDAHWVVLGMYEHRRGCGNAPVHLPAVRCPRMAILGTPMVPFLLWGSYGPR